MNITNEHVEEVVRSVWSMFLGWDAEPAPMPEPDPASNAYTGFVQIAGAWHGAVVCTLSGPLVRKASSSIFGVAESAVTGGLARDALGEITNMIGGNLKPLLPGPNVLCLPAVIEGADYSVCVPTAHCILETSFVSGNEPFAIRILAGAPQKSA